MRMDCNVTNRLAMTKDKKHRHCELQRSNLAQRLRCEKRYDVEGDAMVIELYNCVNVQSICYNTKKYRKT